MLTVISAIWHPDHEDGSSRFHHIIRDRVEFINAQDALDLDEQAMNEAEVAAGDLDDHGSPWRL